MLPSAAQKAAENTGEETSTERHVLEYHMFTGRVRIPAHCAQPIQRGRSGPGGEIAVRGASHMRPAQRLGPEFGGDVLGEGVQTR
jgi:hypothetical protein